MTGSGSAKPGATGHRIAGGVLLVVAPLLLLVAGLLHPSEAETAAEQLRVVRDDLGGWYAGHLLAMIGFGLMLPAMVALARRIRTPAPGLHLTAVALLGVGIVATIAELTIDGPGMWLLAQASDLEVAAPVAENLVEAPEVTVLTRAALAFPVGLIVVGVGLWATRTAHVWKAIAVGFAGVALAVGIAAHLAPAVAGAFLALTAVCVPTGLQELAAARRPPPVRTPASALSPSE